MYVEAKKSTQINRDHGNELSEQMQPRASYLVSNSGAKPFLHFSQCNLFLIPVMFKLI